MRVICVVVGVTLLAAGAAGCTSRDIFHDTTWRTVCDVDADTPGCRDAGPTDAGADVGTTGHGGSHGAMDSGDAL